MKIPGKAIANSIKEDLKIEAQKYTKKGKKPKLVTILIGEAPEQLSFVAIKQKVAKQIGIDFDFVNYKKIPPFMQFAEQLKKYSNDPSVTGIIIQQPLPSELQTDSIYNFIPLTKEIEGHKAKTTFYPPLGLAILTALKYVYGKQEVSSKLVIDMKKDSKFFKKILKHKKIVVVGRGTTGGGPIGKTLSELRINYLSINSQTYQPNEYYKDADIIITATGTKIITADMIKPDVILLNAGLHHEGSELKGDYDEDEIKNIASFYTPTPGGIGPIDVLYLFRNLLDAAKMQK